MTVIKRFRSESKLEVLHTAQRLRRDITFLMLHDFGVRPKVRELQLETKGMSPEDGQMFLAIAEKYGISKADAEWPSWLIGKIRDSLFEILRQLVLHVTAANSIYPAGRRHRVLRAALPGAGVFHERAACGHYAVRTFS